MNNKSEYLGHRASFMELYIPYFWTNAVLHWQHLLKDDDFKWILINSLQWLCKKQLIAVYGFVIMPNHIHLMWEQLGLNGKELPKNSFDKFTAHQFLVRLRGSDANLLKKFCTPKEPDRNHLFWQRQALAAELVSREMAEQKLVYIHENPLQEHWNLCHHPVDYRFSSARFYETGEDEFGIMTHIMDRF